MASASASAIPPHIPVLLDPILASVAPVEGVWVDGTFGAGGYSRALLEAGAQKVIGIDRDPTVFELAADWAQSYRDQLVLIEGTFSNLDDLAGEAVDGVVLDLGVSSMQIDQAERGFSFQKDGPLDMRMGRGGLTAADLVNKLPEARLADVLFQFGEERASRRIARAIVAARPLQSTLELADVIARCLPRQKPGQSHPATRSFQAIRIAVNQEFFQLVQGLEASERALKPGGKLAVVTFHSMEDRVVKRFFQVKSGGTGGNRYAPDQAREVPAFKVVGKAQGPSEVELGRNPRARSARLRVATRTEIPAKPVDRTALGLPDLALKEVAA